MKSSRESLEDQIFALSFHATPEEFGRMKDIAQTLGILKDEIATVARELGDVKAKCAQLSEQMKADPAAIDDRLQRTYAEVFAERDARDAELKLRVQAYRQNLALLTDHIKRIEERVAAKKTPSSSVVRSVAGIMVLASIPFFYFFASLGNMTGQATLPAPQLNAAYIIITVVMLSIFLLFWHKK